jgi:uncharacterized protein (TIGR00255 family)
VSVSVEIKSYNSRFLDLGISLPPWVSGLEPRIREYTASRFGRGKIDVSIRVKERQGDVSVSVNATAARSYYKALLELAEEMGIQEKPSLALIIGLEGVLETENSRDDETYWPVIEERLVSAVRILEAEREREGAHTQTDILSHITALEDSVRLIETKVPEMEALIKENLRARFAEVLGNTIDENRILAETAVLLMKYTISEELSRLSSHLGEFRFEMEHNPTPGKKLDFLCQEINREINTISSKTPILEVSRAVVNMKSALENVREQLRNVE